MSEGDKGVCCRIEAVISIDERGQMVLPKEVRDKLSLSPRDKLAVISWGDRDVCCLILIKVDQLTGVLAEAFSDLFREMVDSGGGSK